MYNIVLKTNKGKEAKKENEKVSIFGKGKEKILECFRSNMNSFELLWKITGINPKSLQSS